MQIVRRVSQMQQIARRLKQQGKTIGFVPTMGYFHEGHLSLMRQSKKDNDVTVVSIFVNPKQFGKNEDLARYPRNFRRDKLFAQKEFVDIIFHPSELEMYPRRYLTSVEVQEMADGLCGRFRPGHFKGVATVVGKLLNIVLADVMYLGQKDAQQAAILRKMVEDLNFPLRVKVMPTVREPDGLAMSSRNSYLSPQDRKEAVVLSQALRLARELVRRGEKSPLRLKQKLRRLIETKNITRIDYIECVDAETLKPLSWLDGKVLVALAVWFGRTRLIDNTVVR